MKYMKILKWFVLSLLGLVLLLVIAVFGYMRLDKFGSEPSGKRMTDIEAASNFRDGEFQNEHTTPQLAEGYSMSDVLYRWFTNPNTRISPSGIIPSSKSDLTHLRRQEDVLVWFGHSSYFIQIDGRRILMDPVFSGSASPVPGTVMAFRGTDIYTVEELPEIDYLFISHDHYDHLDYETVMKLKGKVKKVICPLGVGAHFELWGYDSTEIVERNWYESVALDSGFTATITPARHFSGRTFGRNKTLWCSFLLQTPTMKVYMGGDSGYDTHFADIGNKFGPIDLAMLEAGQYDEAWPYIHSSPDQVVKAAQDLKAKRFFPVHNSKFPLANHDWDDPLKKVTHFNAASGIPLVTPRIGEIVLLKDTTQRFSPWWLKCEVK
jgi:L-ascorbate metabolism protein UlaG (beta-lactamase superfamily)